MMDRKNFMIKIFSPLLTVGAIIAGFLIFMFIFGTLFSLYTFIIWKPYMEVTIDRAYNDIKNNKDELKVSKVLRFRSKEEADKFYYNVRESRGYLFKIMKIHIGVADAILLLRRDDSSYHYYKVLIPDFFLFLFCSRCKIQVVSG